MMWHGLFPQDGISERNSTEFRSDLSFEGLRPGVGPGVRRGTYGRMYSSIARLEEKAS
jgi:hypothetical protein